MNVRAGDRVNLNVFQDSGTDRTAKGWMRIEFFRRRG